MAKAPFILLVNPWITDFAAYDMWAKPLGLLILGSLLRDGGCGVAFVDCLDRHDPFTNRHPDVSPGKDRKYGTGKYPRMRLQKPDVYAEIPRHYYRHGIHPRTLQERLLGMPKPDLIWVTSVMTYWYPGVQQTITALREAFPETPVWLGGIYARLCRPHARQYSGATQVITLPLAEMPKRIEGALGFALKNTFRWNGLSTLPPPALHLVPHLTYAPLFTSTGCPLRCPYCASGILQPHWERRSAEDIFREVVAWHTSHGICDFAFYDDALLIQAETTLKPALERIAKENLDVRFHTPNALHIRALTAEWCALLKESGFTTIRLGLETTRSHRQRQWGGKVDVAMFPRAVDRLFQAGFQPSHVGAYLLCGAPDQSPAEVAEAIEDLVRAGVQPYLAEYSPVPGTPMWSEAVASSGYHLEEEPLYHNNTFFACRRPDFSYQDLLHLKEMARQARQTILKRS